MNVGLPLARPLLGTWSATQACALTGNQTGGPLIHRPALNPLSHTSQGSCVFKYVLYRDSIFYFQMVLPNFTCKGIKLCNWLESIFGFLWLVLSWKLKIKYKERGKY